MRPPLLIARTMVIVALCMELPAPAAAQDSVALPTAARVRMTINEAGERQLVTGNILAMNRDSIFLSGRQAISLDRVIRLEVSDGRQGHPFAGMFIGAAVGAIVVGSAVWIRANHFEPSQYGSDGYTPRGVAVLGGMFGGAVGAPVGLLIGSLKIFERWKPVSIR